MSRRMGVPWPARTPPPSGAGAAWGSEGGGVADVGVEARGGPRERGGHDVRVAGIDDVELRPGLDVELERVLAVGVRRLTDRPRPEAGTRAMTDRVIEGGADDGQVPATPH